MMNCRPPLYCNAIAHLLGAIICLAQPAFAADTDRGEFFTDSNTRDLRQDERKPASAIAWFGSFGTTYIDAEDGSKIWLTPFYLDATVNRNTTFTIESDGYGRIDFGGNTTQGFSNITLIASQVVYRSEASRLRLGVGASAPGSSGIGSQGGKQRISASYSRQLSSNWSLLASGRLSRRNQEPRPGERRIEQFGRLQTSYTFDTTPKALGLLPRALVLRLERGYRHGAGGSSQATASYEFPLSAKLGASIGVTRGLTAGLRDNTFAFDLLFGF